MPGRGEGCRRGGGGMDGLRDYRDPPGHEATGEKKSRKDMEQIK